MRPILYEGMLFGIPILLKSYTTLNLLALAVALVYGTWSLRKQKVSWIKISLLAVAMGISFLVGARVYYAVLHIGLMIENPEKLFAFKLVNFGLYGGLMASLGTLSLWSLKEKRSLWGLLDAGVPALAMALSLSKMACFFNGCCYGVESSVPWAMYFPRAEGGSFGWLSSGLLNAVLKTNHNVLRHPTQLYEVLIFMGSALIVIAVVSWIKWRITKENSSFFKRSAFVNRLVDTDGIKALGYLALVTLGRWGVYNLREYPRSSELTEILRGPVTYGLILLVLVGLSWWRLQERSIKHD